MKKTYQAICEEYAQSKDFSGVCMVRQGNTILFSGAYGYANRAFGVPNRIDTKFDVASITKIFTATAVLLLVERKLLRLEDRITDIIDLENTEIPQDVKIHHLLNHTSGIADDAEEENGEVYSDLFIDHPNYALRKCSDFLPNFAYKKPNFQAGTGIRYNNCAYILLGLAIEKVTGMDCREFMLQSIFAPCSMTNTKFCSMDEINENTAEGYVANLNEAGEFLGWKKNIYSYPPIGTPDGGIYTTVDDLHTFTRELAAGNILTKQYTNMLLAPQCEFTKVPRWNAAPNAVVKFGYAFEFIEIDGEIFSIYKDGINDGVAAIHAFYPKFNITISILSNQSCNIWQMHREMQTLLYNTMGLLTNQNP